MGEMLRECGWFGRDIDRVERVYICEVSGRGVDGVRIVGVGVRCGWQHLGCGDWGEGGEVGVWVGWMVVR